MRKIFIGNKWNIGCETVHNLLIYDAFSNGRGEQYFPQRLPMERAHESEDRFWVSCHFSMGINFCWGVSSRFPSWLLWSLFTICINVQGQGDPSKSEFLQKRSPKICGRGDVGSLPPHCPGAGNRDLGKSGPDTMFSKLLDFVLFKKTLIIK